MQPKSPRTPVRIQREEKKRMTSAEIDFVIRTQEAQMYTGNPFVDDYYFQTMKAQKSISFYFSNENFRII